MKKLVLIFCTSIICLGLDAQRFRPYTSIGLQLEIISCALMSNPGAGAHPFSTGSIRFGLLGQYDYAPVKWFGLNVGAGISQRGGANRRANRVELIYFNVPVKAQFKTGKVFWIEAGTEVKTFLWQSRNTIGFPEENIKRFSLNAVGGFRFNLFRGLSIQPQLHYGLTKAVDYKVFAGGNEFEVDGLYDLGGSLSFRYMFNEGK